jgi:hypothetical protein
VDIIRNPKWYQKVTEKTRVKDNSYNNVENDMKKIAQLYLADFFIQLELINDPGRN